MTKALRHRHVLRLTSALAIAATLGWLPGEKPKRKVRMADAAPASRTLAHEEVAPQGEA